MKRMLQIFRKHVLLSAGLVMLTGSFAFSQSEVTVEQGFNTIIDAVAANPGATLILKRGGSYVVDQAVEITVPTIIKGETTPEETAPAVISNYSDPGEAGSKYLFDIGADFTIQDVGFQGFTDDAQQIKGVLNIQARDITITTDGCIYQSCQWQMWTGGNNNLHIIAKNNIYFNQGGPSWDNGQGYGPLWGGDSIIIDHSNNTHFVGGRIFGNAGSGPNGGQFMNHNSYIATFGDVFFPVTDKDFEIKNCLFYDAEVRGYKGLRLADNGVDTLWTGDFHDWVWEDDSMSGNWCVYPHPLDSTDGRIVNVINNLQMLSPYVQAFHTLDNVTPMTFTAVHVWSLADEFGWTIDNNWLQEDGTEIDPGITVDEGAYTQAFLQRHYRSLPADMQEGSGHPFEIAWRPGGEERGVWIWPLPFDLKPTNKDVWFIGDDGYPLGDLNWFGADVLAAWENGDPNPLPTGVREIESLDLSLVNYPNPFSSTTRIMYDLPVSSHVTMKIYDVAGAEVANLVNESQVAGQHELMFDGAKLSGGVYFCRIKAGNALQVHKMTLIK